MAKDPAFLFYSQDFYTGVATLNWEERGKFISILCLMHQQGRMSEETIRFLVGSVSDNLKTKFRIDEKGLWYNERLEIEAAKRNAFTESRRNNGEKGGRPKTNKPKAKPTQNHKVNHMDNHMGNENVNVIVNEDEILNEYIKWSEQILDNNDAQFETMLFNERWKITPEVFVWLINDHVGLLHRYPKMRPPTQHAFRMSLIKHIRENKDKYNGKQVNGNSGKQTKQDQSTGTYNYIKEHYRHKINEG